MRRLPTVRVLLLAAVLALLPVLPARAGEGGACRAAAAGIGEYLLAAARKEGEARFWAQYEGPGPDALGEERRYPVSLYSGLAGTGWFLLDLAGATGDGRFRKAAEGTGRRLIALARELPGGGLAWRGETERKGRTVPDGDRVGLYDGNAGIGLFLARLAQATGERRFARAATGAFRRILAEAEREETGLHWLYAFGDVIGGEAGTGLALLARHRETGEGPLREAALEAADWLVARAVAGEGTLRWEKRGALDPNFSHGAAGIAFFLASTGREEDLAAARAGAAWIASVARPAGEDGLRWEYWAGEPPAGRRNSVMASWCHGAPGTIRLFLLLHRVTGEERWLETAVRAGRGLMADTGIAAGRPAFANPTLCCGASGCIDAFADLAVATGDRGWLAPARSLAEAVLGELAEVDGRKVHALYDESDRDARKHPYVATGLMKGNAGIGRALLRLGLLLDGEPDRTAPLPDHPFGAPRPAKED